METIGQILKDQASILASSPKTPLLLGREPLRSPPKTVSGVNILPEWALMTPKMQSALSQAMTFQSEWPWYIHGAAGRGKTFAAAWIYLRWPAGGLCAPTWFDAGTIIRALTAARADGGGGRITNTVQDAGLIVVDDLGTRDPTGPQLDALKALIDARGSRPMIVTGNLSPEEMAVKLDERIASRLCAGIVIEVKGEDKRMTGARTFEA